MRAAFEVSLAVYSTGVIVLCVLLLWAVARGPLAWSRWVCRAVAVLGTLAVALRWAAAGHIPMFGTFENTLLASVFLAWAAVVTSLRRDSAGAWGWAAPWSLALLLYGAFFRREPLPLTISEQSLWVEAHAIFAWVAFAGFLAATSVSVPRLLGRPAWGMTPEASDDAIGSWLNVGFLAMTAMILTGAWYLYLLFAEFWRWDVVGTLSMVAWLAYALVIHARLFYSLSGRGLAAAVVSVLPLLLLALWIWSVFPGTYHHFEITLIRPY